MCVFILYILPMIIVVGEIIFMRKCLMPKIPRIVCMVAFIASLVPILGAIACLALPVFIAYLLGNTIVIMNWLIIGSIDSGSSNKG